MPAVTITRLGFVCALLVAAFLVLGGVAVAGLWNAGQWPLAALVALTGVGGTAAGIFILVMSREDAETKHGPPPCEALPPAPSASGHRPSERVSREPVRIQSMPVAELPPEYLHAVMKGTRAWSAAWKSGEQPQPQPRQH